MANRGFDYNKFYEAISTFILIKSETSPEISIEDLAVGLSDFIREINNLYEQQMPEPTARYLHEIIGMVMEGSPQATRGQPFNTVELNDFMHHYFHQLEGYLDNSILTRAFIDSYACDQPPAQPVENVDEAVMTNLFNFLDNNHDGSLSQEELFAFFQLLPTTWAGQPYYNAEIHARYDTDHSGSLNIGEFEQLAIALNAHIGFDILATFLREIYSPAPHSAVGTCVLVQPRPQPRPPQRPPPVTINSCIPGTRFTYEQLAEGCIASLTPNENTVFMGIHNARIRNLSRVNEVLNNAFNVTDVRMPNGNEFWENIKEEFFRCLDRDNAWIEVPPQKRRAEISIVIDAIRGIAPELFWLIYRFLKNQPHPEMLNFWAGSLIRENIEAYSEESDGCFIGTWNRNSHISCQPGMRDRLIPEIRVAIQSAFGVTVAATLSPEEIAAAANIRRRTLYDRWLQEYTTSHPEDGTMDGFVAYATGKIRAEESGNLSAEWAAIIKEYRENDVIQMFFGGGKKYRFKKHYYKTHKRKQTRKKQTRKKQTRKKQTRKKQTRKK
jgi:hypothetical protein